jgi:hypothetical protein
VKEAFFFFLHDVDLACNMTLFSNGIVVDVKCCPV